MRAAAALLLAFLARQEKPLDLKLERHDAFTVACTLETAVESNDGRSTAHKRVEYNVTRIAQLSDNGARKKGRESGRISIEAVCQTRNWSRIGQRIQDSLHRR